MRLNNVFEDNRWYIEKDKERWISLNCDEEKSEVVMDAILQLEEEHQKLYTDMTIEMKALAQVNEFLSEFVSNLVNEKLDDLDTLLASKRMLKELADTLEILAERVKEQENDG